MKTVSKWFFKDFRADIKNLYFLRGLPFLAYSDLSSTDYDIIERVLSRINLNKDFLISVGERQAPFGMTVNLIGDELNTLLNSCQYAFVLTDKMGETDYLLQTVLAGIIPICNSKHIFIDRLGLRSFSVDPTEDYIIDKLKEFKYYRKIFNYRISLLAWQYRNQWKKWNKE